MTASYQHILFAADLNEGCGQVGQRAHQLAQFYGARLSLLHVVASMPLYFGDELVIPETQELEHRMLERARERATALALTLDIEAEDCHVEVGVTKMELLEFIEVQKIDLVVVGSHSRHGLEFLLGSTANAVINRAPCDVLAVKVKK